MAAPLTSALKRPTSLPAVGGTSVEPCLSLLVRAGDPLRLTTAAAGGARRARFSLTGRVLACPGDRGDAGLRYGLDSARGAWSSAGGSSPVLRSLAAVLSHRALPAPVGLCQGVRRKYNRAVPELPEVEVLRRSLEPHLIGRRIDRIEVRNGDLREAVDRRRLERFVLGRRLQRTGRRAKYLLLDLEKATTLVVHLGMSGRLTLASAKAPQQEHEHLAFYLDSGSRLRFRDPRRFGLVFALPSRSLDRDRHFCHLGLEPLGGELSGDALRELARGRRGPIKSFLMDASTVAGLGNIYTAEALFRARIHPSRSVARISSQSWQRLAEAIQVTLEQAIAEGGTTLNDFADGSGREGTFQVSLAVYGHAGDPCPRCATSIRRQRQAGRTTFYCPRCQR